MRRSLLAGALVLAAAGSVRAADLPAKAIAPTVSVAPSWVWYIAIGTEASVQNADVHSNTLFINGLTGGNMEATGGAVTGAIGFVSGNPDRWYRCELQGGYQNITGANNVGGSVASRWQFDEGCDIGFEYIQRIMDALPNLGLTLPVFNPQLPSNVKVVTVTPRQYIGVRAVEQGLDGDFFGKNGSTWSWAPGIKTGYIWQTADATGKANGGMLDAYVRVSWPQRGLTLSGAGFSGNPTFQAGNSIGTQYTAGLKYAFSPF